MPSLATYRSLLAIECGPFVGPRELRGARDPGSRTTESCARQYPIRSGSRRTTCTPSVRCTAWTRAARRRHRYVMDYDPPTGTLTRLPGRSRPSRHQAGRTTNRSRRSSTAGTRCAPFGGLEIFLYEDLEDLGATGVGERFEVLGPSMCRPCTD